MATALSKLPAITIIKCLEEPKGFEELVRCATPYRNAKEVWLDLQLLRVLGLVYNDPSNFKWKLTGKGKLVLRRIER